MLISQTKLGGELLPERRKTLLKLSPKEDSAKPVIKDSKINRDCKWQY